MTNQPLDREFDFGENPGRDEEGKTTTTILDRNARLSATMENHPTIVAWSGGKDSTCVLILVLDAAMTMLEEGRTPMPLHVIHNDTGVENPVVSGLAMRQIADLRKWCASVGLDITVHISEPSLAGSFVVNVLAGSQLPTWPESRNRVCTHKLKIDPARRTTSEIVKSLKAAGITQRPVTHTGSRTDESSRRLGNMRRRGERTGMLADFEGRLVMSPISDWSVTEVFNLLSEAGTSGSGPKVWRENFLDTVGLYREAAGECPIMAEQLKRSTACGARFGCATCTAVNTDRSMETLTADNRYAFMRHLLAIRDYMMAIRYDWSKRSWLTRQVVHVAGDEWSVVVQPDHFDSETLRLLTEHYLYADHVEQRRAERFAACLDAGGMPTFDPHVAERLAAGKPIGSRYLETMREPQFQFLPIREIVAADFYSAVNGKYDQPHAVMEMAWRIRHEGYIPKPLPSVEAPPDGRGSLPSPRLLRFRLPPERTPLGMGNPLQAWHSTESCALTENYISLPTGAPIFAEESRRFDIDEEGAYLFWSMVYPDSLRGSTAPPASTIDNYLGHGLVSLSPSGRARLNNLAVRRQILAAAGLTDLEPAELVRRSEPIDSGPSSGPEQQLSLFCEIADFPRTVSSAPHNPKIDPNRTSGAVG